MSGRTALSAFLGAVVLVGAGCGADTASPGPDPADKRAFAVECIRSEADLPATESGDRELEIGAGTGVRIEFFTSTGEAEGKQFLGGAQDAQQIGAALLHVGDANDEALASLEACLNKLS